MKMVQGPINYMQDVQNPFMQALSGYQMGQNMQIQRQQIAQQQQLAQRKMQMQKDLADFSMREGKTKQDYERMMQRYPELAQQMNQSIERLSEEEKNNKVNQLLPIYAALKAGNIDTAKELMDELIIAYKNSGREDEAKNIELLKNNVDLNPQGAIVSSELFLFNADPEKFSKLAEAGKKFGEERRADQLQPGEIKKQSAELIKMATDQGLTEAEALKTMAQTKKLDAETQKIILETEAMQKGGTLDPEKKFDQERKLAKEYQINTKNFQDVQEAYRRIKAAEDNAAGDLSLIFSYMKMLDPGSVVREGEFATAQNAAGVPQRVLNIYNRLIEGERLGDTQRKQFKNQANSLFSAASKREKEVRSGLEKVIKNYDLNSENIFVGREPESASTTQAQPGPQVFNSMAEAEKASLKLPKGTRIRVGNEIFEVE